MKSKSETESNIGMKNLPTLQSAIRKAACGLATTMTPAEMDAFREASQVKSAKHKAEVEAKQEAARAAFSREERDVFAWLCPRWEAIAATSNAESDYELLLQEASIHFNLPSIQIRNCYLKLEGAGIDT
jgi:hypothetical protein